MAEVFTVVLSLIYWEISPPCAARHLEEAETPPRANWFLGMDVWLTLSMRKHPNPALTSEND